MTGKNNPLHRSKYLREIIKREPGEYAGTYRVLACGHKQRERSGGKAKAAWHAFCETCAAEGTTLLAVLQDERE